MIFTYGAVIALVAFVIIWMEQYTFGVLPKWLGIAVAICFGSGVLMMIGSVLAAAWKYLP